MFQLPQWEPGPLTGLTTECFGEGWSLFGLEVPGIPVVVEGFLAAVGCADWLSSLILDGIVAGVGAVLGFVSPDAGAVYFSCVS